MSVEKVALITAGGSGMGAAAAKRLADDGYRIAILSSSGKGEALAQSLGGVGVTGSNQSNDDVQRIVDLTLQRFGRIDALVNSAGHGPRAPILEISDEEKFFCEFIFEFLALHTRETLKLHFEDSHCLAF